MNKYLITIAIPFYNGYDTTVLILNELASDLDSNYEILISDDNSSFDQSEKLINFIKNNINENSNISYYKNSINLGMDLNFQRCIELSKGKYTWFLGQDDFIFKTKLESLFNYINHFEPNIIYLNYEINRTWNFKKNFIHTNNSNIVAGDDLRDFISTTKGNVPHFLPSLIVKTALWPQFEELEYLSDTYFIQLGAFLEILAKHKKWLYIGEPMSIGVIPNDGWQSSVEKKIRIYCGFMKCILYTYKKYPQLYHIYRQQYYKNYYQHLSLSIEGKFEKNILLNNMLKSPAIFSRSFIIISTLIEYTPNHILSIFLKARKMYHYIKNKNHSYK